MSPRPIALLTDFGHRDPFVGICHGVILREDPAIPIIDITHGIARQDVRAGAVALADAAPYMPADCVFVAVVDPGVGSDRRALALETQDGSVFIGPDNGLLIAGADVRGGVRAAFEISESPWRLEPVSATFHGRDIFTPVAAKISAGARPVESGAAIDHDDLTELPNPTTGVIDGELTTAVLAVDDYGNARLAATLDDIGQLSFGDAVELDTDDMRRHATYVRAYADGARNDPLLLVDSSGSLAVVVNGGSASETLRLTPGKVVRILRP